MTSRYVCSSFYTAHRSSKQGISTRGECVQVCVCLTVYFCAHTEITVFISMAVCTCRLLWPCVHAAIFVCLIQCVWAHVIKCALVCPWVCVCVCVCVWEQTLPTCVHRAFSLACWHSSSLASPSAPNSALIQNRPPVFFLHTRTQTPFSTCYQLTENTSATRVYMFPLSSISTTVLRSRGCDLHCSVHF